MGLRQCTILGANGPFPAGLYPDIKIFKQELEEKLFCGEQVICDSV